MAVPIPTTLSTVLSAVASQLASWPAVNLTLDRIFLNLDPDTAEPTTGDRDILLDVGSERRDPTSDGSGRVEARVIRKLRVRIRTRMNLDENYRSTAWLQGAVMENGQSITLGHLALEDAVIDALYLFQAVDLSSNALMYRPMVYDGTPGAQRRGIDAASGYGYSDIWFDLPYIRLLTQSMQ
jgi:hypothetical protein